MAAIFCVVVWMTCCWTSTRMGLEWLILVVTGLVTVVGTRRTCFNGDCRWGPHSACYHQPQHYLHDYYCYLFVVVVVWYLVSIMAVMAGLLWWWSIVLVWYEECCGNSNKTRVAVAVALISKTGRYAMMTNDNDSSTL